MSAPHYEPRLGDFENPAASSHWKGDGAIYWVTFRLADSIPREKFEAWKASRCDWILAHPEPWTENEWREYNQIFGEQWEAWLDEGMGSCALAREDIRDLVKASILRFDGERLDLHAAVIMPTHVHLLLEPLRVGERQTGMSAPQSYHDLSTLLKGIKGSSARAANKVLGTTGTFWLD